MSEFWSWWVILLAVLTIGLSLFLFVWGTRVQIPAEADGTSGHDWDGLREGVRNLPRWWILISAGGFLVCLGYLVLYPGLGNFKGTLGWSSQDQLQRDTAANDAKLAALIAPWRALTIEQLATKAEAIGIGHRLFLDNCAACHGSEARGNSAVGAPDLTDAIWENGGDGKTILATILDGRSGVMPPWGAALGPFGLNEVAAYVLSLSGAKGPEDQVAAGKKRFETFCVACHGAGGVGNKMIGAPDLTDHAWLYGGDLTSVKTSIRNGRNGVMPGWRSRLGEDQARLIAAWLVTRPPPASPTGN